MDSFYDAPRCAPVPTQVEPFCSAPVVPEVSMLCAPKNSGNNHIAYNTWKMHNYPTENVNVLSSNRQNIIRDPHNFHHPHRPHQFTSPQNTSQFLRKQVRFESPILQQRPSLTYEPFNARKIDTPCCKNDPLFINNQVQSCEKLDLSSRQTALDGKTFEQIYMANVPNRQLDLSMIDLPNNPKIVVKSPIIQEEKEQEVNDKAEPNVNLNTEIHKNKENELPKTYRQFLETQKKVAKENKTNLNDSVTDIFNYKRNKVLKCNKNPLETESASKKSSHKVNTKIKDGKTDCISNHMPRQVLNDHTHTDIQKSFQHAPVYERHDVEIPCLRSPQYNKNQCNTLPSYGRLENNFHQDRFQNFGNCSPKCDGITQTSIDYVTAQKVKEPPHISKDDSEPTNRELLKIIAQQNEQLLILQKQVAMLLNKEQQSQPKQIEAAPQRVNYLNEKCVSSTQNENFRSSMQDINNTPRKRALSKFSIDLMTSFEVAIRPQHNKQNFINYEPKIQEVTESECTATGSASPMDKSGKTVVDTSLHLQEPVKVREMCPSPEPSININMNDYDSSSDDEVSASEIGATFYRNLMGQVNNILKKAHIQTKEDLASREGGKTGALSDKVRDKTMSRVKEATLKHLRNIGVTIGPIDDSEESASSENGSKNYSPTEISFAVKQLLMKYLPDEQLAKITYKQAQSVPVVKDENPGIINARPEFSFASVQYMRKYNLIPANNEVKPRDIEQVKNPQLQRIDSPKILDITALKMQPKLL